MNIRGLLNWLMSAVGAGALVFLTMLFEEGIPTKAKVMASGAAAIAAAVNHIRQHPFGSGT